MREMVIDIRFSNGKGKEGAIDSYYGSQSLFFLAKILNLNAYAYAYAYANSELSNRATNYKNFRSYFLPAKNGSFLQPFLIEFAAGVSVNLFPQFFFHIPLRLLLVWLMKMILVKI